MVYCKILDAYWLIVPFHKMATLSLRPRKTEVMQPQYTLLTFSDSKHWKS